MSRIIKAVSNVGYDELTKRSVNTPPATKTYIPTRHNEFFDLAIERVEEKGFRYKDLNIQLSKDDSRMFATMTVVKRGLKTGKDYELVVGMRNSYDKSAAMGFAIGARVIVCSNMSFYGDLMATHKHTIHSVKGITARVAHAAELIENFTMKQDALFAALKGRQMNPAAANELILKLVESDVLVSGRQVMSVRNQFNAPKHKEFGARTAWALYNGVTDVMKSSFTYRPHLAMNKSVIMTDAFIRGLKINVN